MSVIPIADGEAPMEDVIEAATDQPVEAEPAADAPAAAELTEAQVRESRKALFEEKLAGQREKRQAQRLRDRANADRKAAAEERRLAAEEKAKYDGLKAGSFKETLAALGRDPREAWEEMNREAIEANSPEAIARKANAKIEADLRATQARLEAVEAERKAEREALTARAHEATLVSSFTREIDGPEFQDLRIEYPDEELLKHARYFDKKPEELREHAATYGVRLTQPQKGFTMHELLQVLSAAQTAHNTAKQARLAARSPAEAQPGKAPTVNGTAERRNAGTVSNELASTRASPGPKVSGSVKDRLAKSIDEEIRRSSG